MRRIGTIVSLALVLQGALALSPCGRQAAAAPPGPDSPGDHFWRRNTAGPGPQLGAMDRRLEEIAEAFGRGEFAQARGLAEALLDSTEEAEVRAEAAAFVVQSHLAEGDFEAARAAAERIEDRESLAGIGRIEADYKAEVGRLQRIVATTEDLAEAARAQLLTARAHQQVGRLEVALGSYWEVVARYPQDACAGSALAQIGRIHTERGQAGESVSGAERVIALHPDGASLARVAISLIVNFHVGRSDHEAARTCLQQIISNHPGSEAAARANLALGELLLAEGNPERAARVWAALVAEALYEQTAAYPAVVENLALLRLDLAKVAEEDGRTADAVALLELVLSDPHPQTVCYRAHMEFARGCEELGRYDEAVAAYEELQALAADENTKQWMRYHEAAVLRRAGHQQESAEVFRSVLAQEPGDRRLVAACLAGLAFSEAANEKP